MLNIIEIASDGKRTTVSMMRRKIASGIRDIPGTQIVAFNFWFMFLGTLASQNIETTVRAGYIRANEMRKLVSRAVTHLYGQNSVLFVFQVVLRKERS